jgi:hypothetical protein
MDVKLKDCMDCDNFIFADGEILESKNNCINCSVDGCHDLFISPEDDITVRGCKKND